MTAKKLRGILPAILTPFKEDGDFSPSSFERLLEWVYAAEVDGVYVCGQTGEGLQQLIEQRKLVAEQAVKNSPRGKTVIIHVGAASTAQAIDLARHACRIGAHAVSSLPPIGAYSFAEIKRYYTALAAASDVPLLIYYFPAIAPALKELGQILELCTIPGICGLKFSDSDLFRLWEIQRQGATVFFGTDEMLVAGLMMGAHGGIGSFYTVIPDQFVRLYGLARSGRWQEARVLQAEINEFISIVLRFPLYPAQKQIMRRLGIDCGGCISPRRPLTAKEETELFAQLPQCKIGRKLLSRSAR
jgi:N-acetylneuraminate lyase